MLDTLKSDLIWVFLFSDLLYWTNLLGQYTWNLWGQLEIMVDVTAKSSSSFFLRNKINPFLLGHIC